MERHDELTALAGLARPHITTYRKEAIVNQKSLTWLLLALILGSYALYAFISSGAESAWAIVTGVVCVLGACTAFWRSLVEIRADRE